jgi:hypothetical protein
MTYPPHPSSPLFLLLSQRENSKKNIAQGILSVIHESMYMIVPEFLSIHDLFYHSVSKLKAADHRLISPVEN